VTAVEFQGHRVYEKHRAILRPPLRRLCDGDNPFMMRNLTYITDAENPRSSTTATNR